MRTSYKTYSLCAVYDVLSHENTYSDLVYDGSPALSHFIPDMKRNAWFILKSDKDTAGLIMLEPLNNVLWTAHIVIYEAYRGAGSEEWGKQVADYMRQYCNAKKFIAVTPYETAKNYAERTGFKLLTVLEKSIKKNGELMDQYILEMK